MAGDDHTARHFEWLKLVAADAELTPAAFKLAFLIGEHFNRETGKAWPGTDRLCVKMGSDRRNVTRLLDQLEKRGWLVIDRRKGPKHTNIYQANTRDVFVSSNNHTRDGNVPSNEHHSGQICPDQNSLGTFSTATRDIFGTHSGHSHHINHLEPLQEPKSRLNGWKEENGTWTVPCESEAGRQWERQRPSPARSARTDCFINLPNQYPVVEVAA